MDIKTKKVIPKKTAKKVLRKIAVKKTAKTLSCKVSGDRKLKLQKEVLSEVAVGIILLLAIAVGIIFWIQDRKIESSFKANGVETKIPAKKPIEKSNSANDVIPTVNADNQLDALNQQSTSVVIGDNNESCVPRLYAGDATLHGTYAMTTIPGSTKKEWLFKVAVDDVNKLPRVDSELLFIDDATPELLAKLKKTTENKPETINIKGFYYDCTGVPVVSIGEARIVLAKLTKK